MPSSKTRVLMVSTDTAILNEGSAVRGRLRAYGDRLGALHVLVSGEPKHGKYSRRTSEGKVTVEHVLGSRLLRPWSVARVVREKLNNEQFDVVTAQDPFETGRGALEGIRASRKPKTPLHIQVHTDFLSPWFTRDSLKNRIRVFMAHRVLRSAAGIRVVSERIKKSLMARYGNEIPEPTVIPVIVPVPLEVKSPVPALRGVTFSFLSVGRFESEKRFEDIICAFAKVREKHPEAGLYLVGEGRLTHQLMAKAKALDLEQYICWLGWRTDVSMLMRSVNAYVQASAYEGYGMTLIEAALARLPIVTTDVGIVGDVLRPGKDLIAVPVGNVEALAAEMTRVIEDATLRTALGTEAVHTARNHLMGGLTQPDDVALDLLLTATKS